MSFKEFDITEIENTKNKYAKELYGDTDAYLESEKKTKSYNKEKWQSFITAKFYNCTNEILKCLGLMYVEDERFKKNIDKNGEGTAEFISKAILFYCTK